MYADFKQKKNPEKIFSEMWARMYSKDFKIFEYGLFWSLVIQVSIKAASAKNCGLMISYFTSLSIKEKHLFGLFLLFRWDPNLSHNIAVT